MRKTLISRNTSKLGESIETKIERAVSNKEPLTDQTTPIIYTERKEGIRKSCDIRTDRFEIAVEASDKVAKSYKARREEAQKKRENKQDGEPKPIHTKPENGEPNT